MAEAKRTISDSFKAYEEGKHRRYNLLFAVNGGAFAVAQLFTKAENTSVLGGLALWQLSLGMIAFSGLTVWDIWAFGQTMREHYLPDPPDRFGFVGKTVLLVILLLICVGWFLVGFLEPPSSSERGGLNTVVLCSSCSIPQAGKTPHLILLDQDTGKVWAYKELHHQPILLGQLTKVGSRVQQ